jgi:Na+/H+-dicarboxylate symporter
MTVAFSTSSSNATLPVNMEVTEKRNGVSKSMASFVLPLGATINMDGTAIMQGVATVFISQVYGIHLTLGDLATVVLTATLASIGTAGMPGVGLVTLSMVLVSVNLPVEGIALVIGVDRILDMLRTVVNITGDAVTAVVVAKSENEWDRAIFEQQNPEER